MPSPVHLIFRAKENNPDVLLIRFKEYTSKQIVTAKRKTARSVERNGCFGCLNGQAQKAAM